MYKSILLFLFVFQAQAFSVWIPADQAIERLLDGNQRHVNQVMKLSKRSAERREETIESQEPFAAVLSCSDSRGAPEIIFDQGIGNLFVVRVAGNVVGPIEIASLDFSVLHLNTSLVMVLGHQNCGAVKAVMQGATEGIEPIAKLIAPAVQQAKSEKDPSLENAIKDNAIHVAKKLQKNPAYADLIKNGKLKIVPAYHSFATGKVEILSIP